MRLLVRTDEHVDWKALQPYMRDQVPGENALPWQRLKVVSLMDGCTARLALAISNAPDFTDPSFGHCCKQFLNQIARLLDVVQADEVVYAQGQSSARLILISYLWSVWQRSATLYFSYIVRCEVQATFVEPWQEMLALTFPKMLSEESVRFACHSPAAKNSQYMCAWAFELLQATQASLALDFRRFHRRFAETYPNARARCTTSTEQCVGTSPEACGRFVCKELVREEQSLHDTGCTGCERLLWDEKSYRKATRGRAVDLSRRSLTIKYCTADEDTLAVSHVWSHGQGGRPSTGINTCLHNRYVRLANNHGCSSYWIDTVCIPEAHELRAEAIRYINQTFMDAKITLICDRDLMSMRAPVNEEDCDQIERLLCTLLVCDWNVRAWTFLESVRGRRNAHIMCANDVLLSVRDLVQGVLAKGALDIAAIALSAQHLLPQTGINTFSITQASALLNHRHATRKGDDIVIWSLLCRGKVASEPEQFWKSRMNAASLETGYLMSSAPCLQGVKGFGWAPRCPNTRSPTVAQPSVPLNFHSSDGSGSEIGRITSSGLEAIWLVYEVQAEDNFKVAGGSHQTRNEDSTSHVTFPCADDFLHATNPCWLAVEELRRSHPRVALLLPKSTAIGRHFGAEDSKHRNPLVAVAFSDEVPQMKGDVEDEWQWAGVHEWNVRIALPEMEWQKILLT